MEPVTILAASAVSFLVPYFQKFGEGVAGEAAKKAFAAPAQIYGWLKRMTAGSDVDYALEDLKARPADDAAQARLKEALSAVLAGDPQLAAALDLHLRKAAAERGAPTFVTTTHGDNGKVVNIGTVKGNVSL